MGIVVISNCGRNLKKLACALGSLWRPPHYTQSFYLELLRLLYVVLSYSRRSGFPALGSPHPTATGDRLFKLLADELGKLPNSVALEGHTDSRPFRSSGQDAYGNWELSFDPANMARRRMVERGLHGEQVAEARGYADRKPLVEDDADSRNRRISIIVRF